MHLYIGEEAAAVGAIGCLEAEDAVVATYREHGQALLRGVSPCAIMAETYGKLEGCARGRGGSMHFFDESLPIIGPPTATRGRNSSMLDRHLQEAEKP